MSVNLKSAGWHHPEPDGPHQLPLGEAYCLEVADNGVDWQLTLRAPDYDDSGYDGEFGTFPGLAEAQKAAERIASQLTELIAKCEAAAADVEIAEQTKEDAEEYLADCLDILAEAVANLDD